jgi:hypothetical protein
MGSKVPKFDSYETESKEMGESFPCSEAHLRAGEGGEGGEETTYPSRERLFAEEATTSSLTSSSQVFCLNLSQSERRLFF